MGWQLYRCDARTSAAEDAGPDEQGPFGTDRRSRFDSETLGRIANLALRIAALGYTKVYWYRGGREAWEVAGLPEAAIEAQGK